MTLPDNGPAPVSAEYALVANTWTVKFDQPLRSAALDPTNWALRLNNFTVTTLTAVASGRFVTGTASKVAGAPSPNDVGYAPPPFDVLGRLSVPAPLFSDFPLLGV